MTTASDEREAAAAVPLEHPPDDAARAQLARARATQPSSAGSTPPAATHRDGPGFAERAGKRLNGAWSAVVRHPRRWQAWDRRPKTARELARAMSAHPWWTHDVPVRRWAAKLFGAFLLGWHVLFGWVQEAPRSRVFWGLVVTAALTWLVW